MIEVPVTDRHKIVVSRIDYVRPHERHIDIRSHYLTPIKETVKKKDATGRLVPEIIERLEWCRASQGISVPLDAWLDFVNAVNALAIERKSSS